MLPSPIGWRVYSAHRVGNRIRLYGMRGAEYRIDYCLMIAELDADGMVQSESEMERLAETMDWGTLGEVSVFREGPTWYLYRWGQLPGLRSGLYCFHSPDGLRWSPMPFNPVIISLNDAASVFLTHAGEVFCYQQLWHLRQAPGADGFHAHIDASPLREKNIIRRTQGLWFGKENGRMTKFENLEGPLLLSWEHLFPGAQIYRFIPFVLGREYRAIAWRCDAADPIGMASVTCHLLRSQNAVDWEYLHPLPPGKWFCPPLFADDGSSLWWKDEDGKPIRMTETETSALLGQRPSLLRRVGAQVSSS